MRSLPALKAINMQLEELLALQQTLSASVPADLRPHVRIAYRDGKRVHISASNSAWAARLRILGPRVLRRFAQHDSGIEEIKVTVDVSSARRDAPAPPRRIESSGIRNLTQLMERLPEGSLRHAVAKLLRGQLPSNDENQAFERPKGEE